MRVVYSNYKILPFLPRWKSIFRRSLPIIISGAVAATSALFHFVLLDTASAAGIFAGMRLVRQCSQPVSALKSSLFCIAFVARPSAGPSQHADRAKSAIRGCVLLNTDISLLSLIS